MFTSQWTSFDGKYPYSFNDLFLRLCHVIDSDFIFKSQISDWFPMHFSLAIKAILIQYNITYLSDRKITQQKCSNRVLGFEKLILGACDVFDAGYHCTQ